MKTKKACQTNIHPNQTATRLRILTVVITFTDWPGEGKSTRQGYKETLSKYWHIWIIQMITVSFIRKGVIQSNWLAEVTGLYINANKVRTLNPGGQNNITIDGNRETFIPLNRISTSNAIINRIKQNKNIYVKCQSNTTVCYKDLGGEQNMERLIVFCRGWCRSTRA